MSNPIDLGHDHVARPTVWDPDLELNPDCADAPGTPEDVVGFIVEHKRADNGLRCAGAITLDTPRGRYLHPDADGLWQVVSLDPETLHLEPSLLCRQCGDHGFIREGRWVPA